MLASDKLDGQWAMLWGDEQRGIGELMTEQPPGAPSIVRGHASFYRDYDKIFAEWMGRFADDLFTADAVSSNRLQLLQWALYGLVRQLDEKGAYGGGWIELIAREISETSPQVSVRKHEPELRAHLAAFKPPTSSLSGCRYHAPVAVLWQLRGCADVAWVPAIACLCRRLLARMW